MTDLVSLLSDLVSFRSLSHEEEAIADYVERRQSADGLEVGRKGNNVYGRLGDGPVSLLLNSHLDVVPESEGHPYDPYVPTIVNGVLFGRGSVDAKASVAAMMNAMASLASSGFQPPFGSLMVATTACEERGGGYNGLQDLLPDIGLPGAAIIGEPTSLVPVRAQRGILILDCEATGRSAHAGRAHLGDNAIMTATRDVGKIAELTFEHVHPLLGPISLNVTEIRGGTAHNVIPDLCRFTIDVRTTPAYNHDDLVDQISAILDSAVSIRSSRYIPVETDAHATIVGAAERASKNPATGSPTASDWVYLPTTPTVKFGPGNSELSHTANEGIDLSELEQAAEMYRAIVIDYYRNEANERNRSASTAAGEKALG